jgi:hypothetical protein
MEAFRSALATTLEQVRAILAAGSSGKNGQSERFVAELGEFASDRIDIDRFSKLFTTDDALNSVKAQRIDRAYETMSGLIAQGDNLFVLNIEEGGNLHDSVAKTLEHLGTAFGAARVVELSRTERYQFENHAKLVSAFPFADWNTRERRLAPPLIVVVDGKDLNAGALAEFLDGAQKIVLVVRGASPPAPLARLITPNTFVVQTTDGSTLERFAEWKGAGIAAVVPESAARFVHDPTAGSDHMVVDFLPESGPSKPLGGISAAQQGEELRQLKALCDGAGSAVSADRDAAGAGPPAGGVEPVDKLAAWLLQQADLSDVG